MTETNGPPAPWRRRIHTIIFEADTPGGKAFDVGLFVAIVLSVLAVSLESVESIGDRHDETLRLIEWIFTIGFTIEYALRLICVGRPLRYGLSFFGIVDLLAILPTYLSLLFVGSQSLIVIRAIRLLRVFRVFKLASFLGEASILREALVASRRKILIFVATVLTLVLILGTVMYLVEGDVNGEMFSNIPQSIYWAIVTLTTVGYGDITPVTVLGKMISSVVMITGYAIIAVPTGIVTVELSRAQDRARTISTQACLECAKEGHDVDARFCKYCGADLGPR